MPEIFSLKGTTIWSTDDGGVGWEFKAGVIATRMIEKRAEGGSIGYWLKPGGKEAATHRLTLEWITTDKQGIEDLIAGLMGLPTGTLTLPDSISYYHCTIEDAGEFESFKVDEGFAVKTTLSIKQYP